MGRYDGRPGQPGRPLNVGTPRCGKDLVSDRPPRCRPLPAALVDALAVPVADGHEAELVRRLELALAALPEAERTAVVSAYAYAGGPVGAAVELGLEVVDADALTRNGLQLLRGALADLDPHGAPLA